MNLESLRLLLNSAREFSHIMIEDDKYDIGFPSGDRTGALARVHHYQWGAVLKILSEAGLQLIEISQMKNYIDSNNNNNNKRLPPKYMGYIKKQQALPAPPSAPSAPKID